MPSRSLDLCKSASLTSSNKDSEALACLEPRARRTASAGLVSSPASSATFARLPSQQMGHVFLFYTFPNCPCTLKRPYLGETPEPLSPETSMYIPLLVQQAQTLMACGGGPGGGGSSGRAYGPVLTLQASRAHGSGFRCLGCTSWSSGRFWKSAWRLIGMSRGEVVEDQDLQGYMWKVVMTIQV